MPTIAIHPDLTVEVDSSHEEVAGLNEKVEEYLAASVPLAWVIDPDNEIVYVHRKDGSVTRLRQNDELSGEDVLPGLKRKAAELFPDTTGF